jgi:hypothetical protein
VTDKDGEESAAGLVEDARATLAGHVANEAGFCAACLAQWARLTPHPCPQASWATAVIDRNDHARPSAPRQLPRSLGDPGT